jgi:hypothetical protein
MSEQDDREAYNAELQERANAEEQADVADNERKIDTANATGQRPAAQEKRHE